MWGGAVAVLSDAAAVFRRCFFQQNVADRGGAVYVKGETGGRRALATLESCELTANRADEGGGTPHVRPLPSRLSPRA
jgi:predicted outer membrane repeat protein